MVDDVVLVVTAGHIDHGKTSLVRALTGVDLDVLPEERERGITIALGFTHLDLPDGRRVAFIDAPGHERLVRTMAAGAHGVDGALLVVAADDGVMPQTREHLAILELLGVTDGAIVLTKVDLVDEDLRELVAEDVADLVKGTFLAGKPVLGCSARTGEGLEALKGTLAGFARRARREDGPFRLPVDRAFVRPGFGTVVTGTVLGGVLADGATVTLLPSGVTARVRGIQHHGHDVPDARPGRRTALNLAGVELEAVPRGTVVAQGDVPCASIVDATYRHLSEDVELEDGASVRVLLGTAERVGRIHLAVDQDGLLAGEEAPVQIRLDEPLPCLPGDRFVVRRVSPVTTLGGGVVRDPWAPRMRHRDRVAWGKAVMRLASGERAVWLERAGEDGVPAEAWASRSPEGGGGRLGDRVLAGSVVGRLEGLVVEALRAFHQERPLALGANRRELRRGRLGHLSEKVFDGLLERLAGKGTVTLDGPLVRASAFAVALDPATAALKVAIEADLVAAGMSGCTPASLGEAHGSESVEALLRLLEKEGRVVRVPDLGWVAAEVTRALRADLVKWFAASTEPLTPAAFRDAYALNRKLTLPWLAFTDREGWTRRLVEGRGPGPALGA